MRKMAFVLAAVLLLGLCGCTRQRPAPTAPTESATAPTASATVPTEPATAPTDPAARPSAQPTEPTAAPTQPTDPPTAPTAAPTEPAGPEAVHYADVKAMWLSQFDLTGIYLDGKTQRAQADFTERMAQVLANVQAQGFNTVFLQIRPNADSMYPSAYYPMSAYVTGSTGTAAQYDPVEITVRLAHEKGLSIHAWINPMRGMKESELAGLSGDYPLAQWYRDPSLRGKYVVVYNGLCYLNPAYAPVRALIADGAREALTRYAFDGLHMDDYFYPTTAESFDASAYAELGGGRSLAAFRRDSLSLLVGELYAVTHSFPGRVFGVSPAGNADTVYNKQYADIYRWCANEGYLDYICPQVYFGLEHGSHDFVKVCGTFRDMIKTDSVKLIIGMSFGKALSREDAWAGSGKNEWKEHTDVLARSLKTTRTLEKCTGVAVFCYQYFYEPVSGVPVAGTAQERENFVAVLKDTVWQRGM